MRIRSLQNLPFLIPGGSSPRKTVRATVQQACGLHHQDILPLGPQLLVGADTVMPCGACGTSPLQRENIPVHGRPTFRSSLHQQVHLGEKQSPEEGLPVRPSSEVPVSCLCSIFCTNKPEKLLWTQSQHLSTVTFWPLLKLMQIPPP